MRRPAARWSGWAAVVAGALAAAGCGGGGSAPGAPAASSVPLAAGASVTAPWRECDPGAHAYCGRQLVVAAPASRYPSSAALQTAEAARLKAAGWTSAEGDIVDERSSESPGETLRLTYATDEADLEAIDLGKINRDPTIARALGRQMFAGTPALSLMLVPGSS